MREAFYFKVKYQLICESEYEQAKAEWEEKLLFNRKTLKLGDHDADAK